MVGPYSSFIQWTIGPSNYYRDHNNIIEYTEKAAFLPYLNNEKDHAKSNTNKKRFESLNFLTLVKFLKDPIIFPRESSWFGDTTKEGKVIPMEETRLYKENLFGLKTLDEEGRILRKEIDGLHLQFVNEHIQEVFVTGLNK
jgi:palmitoyl-protein thioesterase